MQSPGQIWVTNVLLRKLIKYRDIPKLQEKCSVGVIKSFRLQEGEPEKSSHDTYKQQHLQAFQNTLRPLPAHLWREDHFGLNLPRSFCLETTLKICFTTCSLRAKHFSLRKFPTAPCLQTSQRLSARLSPYILIVTESQGGSITC